MRHVERTPAPLGGVFEANPNQSPTPPFGARAVELRDDTGRTVAFAWVIAERSESLVERAYNWLDVTSHPRRPPLSLMP